MVSSSVNDAREPPGAPSQGGEPEIVTVSLDVESRMRMLPWKIVPLARFGGAHTLPVIEVRNDEYSYRIS